MSNVEDHYAEVIKVINDLGPEAKELGIGVAWAYLDDPKHLLFTLSRYKFVSKMFDGMKKILEIGCGNGKLLYQFKKKGALVKGVEIGPQADVAKKTYGLDVINKPLSKKNLNEKFDCIFSYGCLEHIDDLESFFEESRSCLNNNGLFFHSVPNSKLSFKQFNLDHLLHQHINYFTPKNGVSLFNSQGFKDSSFSLTKNKNERVL